MLLHLAKHHHRLPDQAQPLIAQAGTRPDFAYTAPDRQACVYVDGPYHEFPERQSRDAGITRKLEDIGYLVIRVQGEETWPQALHEYGWVFGQGS